MQQHRRHELKEDEFVTTALNTWTYVQQNTSKILAGVGVVAILILIGVFVQKEAERKAEEAVNLLGDVQVHILNNETGEAILAAERVVDEYADEAHADQALLILGNLYMDLGRTAETRDAFQKRLDLFGDDGPGGYAATAGLATALEQMDNIGEAAATYAGYANRHTDSPFAPLALVEAARCYRLSGDISNSAETYRKVVQTYPTSSARQKAESELNLMGEDV